MNQRCSAEAGEQEQADLESVLEDMYEKVEELQQVLKEHISTKNALKVLLLAHTPTCSLLCLCSWKTGHACPHTKPSLTLL